MNRVQMLGASVAASRDALAQHARAQAAEKARVPFSIDTHIYNLAPVERASVRRVYREMRADGVVEYRARLVAEHVAATGGA